MEALENFWHFLTSKLGQQIAIAFVSVLGAIAYALIRYFLRILKRFLCFIRSRHTALRAVARDKTRDGPREGRGLWVKQPIDHPEHYKRDIDGAKIITVANLKGGVGKTTLAANIAAFLASDVDWEKRILLIDLDYQGSLSSMALPEDESVASLITRNCAQSCMPTSYEAKKSLENA